MSTQTTYAEKRPDSTRTPEARNRAVTLRKIRRDNRVLGWRS